MTNFLAGIAQENQDIEEVAGQNLDPETKKSLVKSMRAQSFQGARKSSSFQIILSISNTMVGSSTLVFPVLYQTSGIAGALAIALILCLISCKTTQLLVVHNKIEEVYITLDYFKLDLAESLSRVLGNRWNQIFGLSNILLLYFANVVYFILMCTLCYALVQFVCEKFDIETADQNTITFDKLSFQYIGCIYILVLLPLYLMKDLRIILRILQYGSISVICYILFIIYKGSSNLITNYSKCINNLNWFNFDVFIQFIVSFQLITIAGVFAVSFNIQAAIIPIIKSSANQSKNKRDIAIGFGWTWMIYAFIGTFGASAVSGISKRDGTTGNTVLDYMNKDDILTIIVQILILFQLTSVSPVLQFITRSQFFNLLYDLQQPPKWQYYGYTIVLASTTLIIQICNINVSLILSLAGALIGFFQVFLIPVLLHMRCLYPQISKLKVSSTYKPTRDQWNMNTQISSDGLIENPDMSSLPMDEEVNRNVITRQELKCNDHSNVLKTLSRSSRQIIYSCIVAIGVAIAILSVSQIIKQKLL